MTGFALGPRAATTARRHPAARPKPATAPPDATPTGRTAAPWAQRPVLLPRNPPALGCFHFRLHGLNMRAVGRKLLKSHRLQQAPTRGPLSTFPHSTDAQTCVEGHWRCCSLGWPSAGGWSRNHRGSRSPVKGLRAASPPTEAFSLSSPYKQVQAILPHTGDLSGRFLTAAFTLPPSCGHDQD